MIHVCKIPEGGGEGFHFLAHGLRKLDPLSFHGLCVDMHVNKNKSERNGSLECYHMTRIGKTKYTS